MALSLNEHQSLTNRIRVISALIVCVMPCANREGLEVTDDVSIVEQLGDAPVVVTPGEYTNIKLTTPDDIVVAERILAAREGAGVGVGSIAV